MQRRRYQRSSREEERGIMVLTVQRKRAVNWPAPDRAKQALKLTSLCISTQHKHSELNQCRTLVLQPTSAVTWGQTLIGQQPGSPLDMLP